MAKKRRKHEEEKEEKEYKSPEFDEREFLQDEIQTGKATIMAAIISIPVGILIYMITGSMGEENAWLGFLIGIMCIGSLYFVLPAVNVDVKKMKPKQWFGPISTYIFTFLAIWILLVNPPFADHAGPQFIGIDVGVDGEPITILGIADNTTNKIRLNEMTINGSAMVTVNATITDNDLMGSASIWVGNSVIPMVPAGPDMFFCDVGNITETVVLTLEARDSTGNNRTYEIKLFVNAN